MLSNQHHKLRNCFLEVEVLEGDSTIAWQEKVADLFQYRVLPRIEKIFDRVGDADKMLLLDHVEIDIGIIDPQQWEKDLETSLISKLERAIVAQLHEQIPLTDYIWNSFLHFLQTGEEMTLLAKERSNRREAEIIDLIDHKRAQELKSYLRNKGVRSRLVKQFSTDFWRYLLNQSGWETLKINLASVLPASWDYSSQTVFLQRLSEAVDKGRSPAITSRPEYSGRTKNKNGHQSGRGLYIDNAGMVLLYPFFQPLFSSLGWLERGDFTSLDEKNKAISLLEYLVSGREEVAESELVLPKLLCGWPNDVALNRFVELSENTKSEGEKVLLDVIEYWEVMQGTPVEGLREGFLQREGKLIRLPENQWKLKVARQTMDILLTSLPWGLSVVTLPWMNSMLFVEWK